MGGLAASDGAGPPQGAALAAAREQSGDAVVHATCRELYEHRQWLWTFLGHEGVEPTNNAGERSLRHAVIWRKLSFGAQSASGSRFVGIMLTVIETCRQQRRNVFAYLTTAVEAQMARQPDPLRIFGARTPGSAQMPRKTAIERHLRPRYRPGNFKHVIVRR